MTSLPKSFTACEEYRGFTIALKKGFYEIFNSEGGIYLESRYTSLERARRGIDQLDHCSRFTASLGEK
jgi:hypothetical protein